MILIIITNQQTSFDFIFIFLDTLTGKLFRSSDLSMVVEFFLMFHKDKPVDWLMDHILWVKVCNPEKDQVSGAQAVDRLYDILLCFAKPVRLK